MTSILKMHQSKGEHIIFCCCSLCHSRIYEIQSTGFLLGWKLIFPEFNEKSCNSICSVINLFCFFIFFCRFFKRFELPLLAQSLVMNITMFLMIHLCVKVKRNNSILKARERVFTGKWHFQPNTIFLPLSDKS